MGQGLENLLIIVAFFAIVLIVSLIEVLIF